MERTPIFRIEAAGQDVTERIARGLRSLSLTDFAGGQSDQLRLEVYGAFRPPAQDEVVKLWMGYRAERLSYFGHFLVQSTTRASTGTMTIEATGADFSEALKKARSAKYENTTLKGVCEQVARRHKLELNSDMDGVGVKHQAQTNESDLAFMRRMAIEYDALFSIKNGTIVFLKRSEEEGAEAFPRYDVKAETCLSWSLRRQNRSAYASCRASWHDAESNEAMSVRVGSGEPELLLEERFASPEQARKKAQARLDAANRGLVSGQLSLPGDALFAGGKLNFQGVGEDSGLYTIKQVSHSLGQGWTMDVEFEN